MQENDEPLSSQDAVDSAERLRKTRISFRFANESDAEEWDRDGRIDEGRQPDITAFPEH